MTEEGSDKTLTPDERAERPEVARYLIDLILKQDDVTQRFLEFLIAVQAGLVVAFGFLMRPGEVAGEALPVPRTALTLVTVAGVAFAGVLTALAVLTQKWQGLYIARFNELRFKQKVFPFGIGSVTKPAVTQPMDAYTRLIVVFGSLVIAGWFAVYLFVVRPVAE